MPRRPAGRRAREAAIEVVKSRSSAEVWLLKCDTNEMREGMEGAREWEICAACLGVG
jgi:hypothetical protein